MNNLLEKKAVIRVGYFLKNFDNNIKLIELNETARTAIDAAKSLNTEVGSIIKSLLFKDSENNFHLCLVSGDKFVSLEKISNIFNSHTIKQMLMNVKNLQVLVLEVYLQLLMKILQSRY